MGLRARFLMDFPLPLPACCRGHGKWEAEAVRGDSVVGWNWLCFGLPDIEPARRLGTRQ
jgi:hypothetical protein